MKSYVIFLLTLLGLFSKSTLYSTDIHWQGVYEKKVSPSRIYRLWLKSNQEYLLAFYEKNRITIDSGSFSLNNREITFKSSFKRNSVSIKEHQKIYLAKKGLNEGESFLRRKLTWKKINLSSTIWLYNPVANELFVHGEYFSNEKKPIFTKYTKAQKSKIQLALIDSAQRIEDAKNKRSEELLIIQETKASYLETIKENLPEYYSMMDEHYCGPGCFEELSNGAAFHLGKDSVFSWNNWNNEAIRMKYFNITIHETMHKARYEKGLDKTEDKSNPKDNTYTLFDSKLETKDVDFIDIPKSEYIISVIPENFLPKFVPHWFFKSKTTFQSILPRQTTYLTENTTSNHHGIYGLLDEFSAYYHGFNATLLLYERNEEMFEKFQYDDLNDLVSNEFAYYEFKLFIAWYLKYLIECEPNIYNQVASNKNLRHVYNSIDVEFSKRCKDFEKIINKHDSIKKSYNALRNDSFKEILLELERQKPLLEEFTKGKQNINFTFQK